MDSTHRQTHNQMEKGKQLLSVSYSISINFNPEASDTAGQSLSARAPRPRPMGTERPGQAGCCLSGRILEWFVALYKFLYCVTKTPTGKEDLGSWFRGIESVTVRRCGGTVSPICEERHVGSGYSHDGRPGGRVSQLETEEDMTFKGSPSVINMPQSDRCHLRKAPQSPKLSPPSGRQVPRLKPVENSPGSQAHTLQIAEPRVTIYCGNSFHGRHKQGCTPSL